MSRIKKIAVALAAAIVLVLPLSACSSHDAFNGWMAGCLAEGGHPSLTHRGEWSDRYECFKDDEVIVVPGYAGE